MKNEALQVELGETKKQLYLKKKEVYRLEKELARTGQERALESTDSAMTLKGHEHVQDATASRGT